MKERTLSQESSMLRVLRAASSLLFVLVGLIAFDCVRRFLKMTFKLKRHSPLYKLV